MAGQDQLVLLYMTDEIQPFTGGHIICDNAVLENEGIIFEGCIFYADRITPDISALYWVDDGSTLSSSVTKRVAEFTAGQICASRALARQGYSAKVPGRSRRIPVWPAGICGSISHTDTLACAIVIAGMAAPYKDSRPKTMLFASGPCLLKCQPALFH